MTLTRTGFPGLAVTSSCPNVTMGRGSTLRSATMVPASASSRCPTSPDPVSSEVPAVAAAESLAPEDVSPPSLEAPETSLTHRRYCSSPLSESLSGIGCHLPARRICEGSVGLIQRKGESTEFLPFTSRAPDDVLVLDVSSCFSCCERSR